MFRGTYRTFWPPPFHVENRYPTGKYPDQKVWVWVPFSSLIFVFLMSGLASYRPPIIRTWLAFYRSQEGLSLENSDKSLTCRWQPLGLAGKNRRRTNVQQLTCKIDLSNSFYYFFFSFVLLELKPFVLKGLVQGEKLWKSAKKCQKVWKIMKRFCPLVVAL